MLYLIVPVLRRARAVQNVQLGPARSRNVVPPAPTRSVWGSWGKGNDDGRACSQVVQHRGVAERSDTAGAEEPASMPPAF